MSCLKFVDAIVDHAYGAPLLRRAAEHLATCSECQRTFERHAEQARNIDATIRNALAIAPSIEFERGVRERIGRSRAAVYHTIWWSALATAAAVLVVVTLGALRERTSISSPQPRSPVSRASADIHLAAPVGPVAPEWTPGIPPHRAARREPTRRAEAVVVDADREFVRPVLVSPNQRRAIARLMELLEDGTLDPERLPRPDAFRGEPIDLLIPPLTVDPIVISNVEDSGRPGTGPGRP
jgi:hypothetical protein